MKINSPKQQTKKNHRAWWFLRLRIAYNSVRPIMHTPSTTVKSATRFAIEENVSRTDFHLASAMHAAEMVRYQYSKESKSKLIRECLGHLAAFLSPARAGASHE